MQEIKPDIEITEISERKEVYEAQLQMKWNRLKPGKNLLTHENKSLKIISTGTWNVEAGPDFINAKIMLDNQTLTGDIEVHSRASDWFDHGHEKDPAYRNVILHVVAEYQGNNNKTPSLPTLIIEPPARKYTSAPADKFQNGKCVNFFANLEDDAIHNFLTNAGTIRFHEKSESILKEMLKNGAEFGLLKYIFAAMGYKKNQDNFIELFKRYYSYSDEDKANYSEIIIWGESGLMPDPAASDLPAEVYDFLTDCWDKWWKLRIEARKPIQWIRHGVRPLNSPERRVAAISLLLKKLDKHPLDSLVKLFDRNRGTNPKVFWKQLKVILSTTDPLWDTYTNFFDRRNKSAAVLGEQRILDLAVNAVVPSIHAFAILQNIKPLKEFAENVWRSLPRTQNNRHVKIAVHRYFMPPVRAKNILTDAASIQGILHLYKKCCIPNYGDCKSCAFLSQLQNSE